MLRISVDEHSTKGFSRCSLRACGQSLPPVYLHRPANLKRDWNEEAWQAHDLCRTVAFHARAKEVVAHTDHPDAGVDRPAGRFRPGLRFRPVHLRPLLATSTKSPRSHLPRRSAGERTPVPCPLGLGRAAVSIAPR